MSWTHHINEGKNDKRYFFYHRWFWYLGESGHKCITLEICSNPNFSWGLDVNGSDSRVLIYFWFIWKFYIGFESIFPKWIYIKEYNQFADKSTDLNVREQNKKLKGKAKCRETGWIPTGSRTISLSFFEYTILWDIWIDNHSWSSDTPKWRHGSFNLSRFIKGKDKVTNSNLETFTDVIKLQEGIYYMLVEHTEYIKTYQRWFTKRWTRYNFKFGYFVGDKWIDTPVIHWGKGENSYDCGMDGTYSMSTPANIKSYIDAKDYMFKRLKTDRHKYGDIDFKNITGIEKGIVIENLIGKFNIK